MYMMTNLVQRHIQQIRVDGGGDVSGAGTVEPHRVATLEVDRVVAEAALPRPRVVQAPDHLTTQVAPRGVVASYPGNTRIFSQY